MSSTYGHFYEVELTRTKTERAKVRVFIPATVKTSDVQCAFAEAQALADGAWVSEGSVVKISDLSQKESASVVSTTEQERMYDAAYGTKR